MSCCLQGYLYHFTTIVLQVLLPLQLGESSSVRPCNCKSVTYHIVALHCYLRHSVITQIPPVMQCSILHVTIIIFNSCCSLASVKGKTKKKRKRDEDSDEADEFSDSGSEIGKHHTMPHQCSAHYHDM